MAEKRGDWSNHSVPLGDRDRFLDDDRLLRHSVWLP